MVFLVYLERSNLAPGVDSTVEPEEGEGPSLEPDEEHAVVHDGVVGAELADLPPGAPAAPPHHHRLPEVQPEVQQAARHLLLVREAQLDRAEGDVEALNETLLTHRHEHRAVRVAE